MNSAATDAQQESGVLQPSTNFQALDGSHRTLFRLAAIVAVAAGIAATALLVLSVAATLDAVFAA